MTSIIVTIIVIIAAINDLDAVPNSQQFDLKKWELFKMTFGKNYLSHKEERIRLALFFKKLIAIKIHNKKAKQGDIPYTIGINKFSDLTEEELHLYTHGFSSSTPPTQYEKQIFKPSEGFQIPASKDWRKENIVPAIKYQGQCGSCWAFSTNGAMESHYSLYKNKTVSLSEQQLIDCVTESSGCQGGQMATAYAYIAKNGINTEMDYPYTRANGESCRYKPDKEHYTIKSSMEIEEGNEDHLLAAVAEKGPVSVAIDARGNFAAYEKGVYYNANCSSKILTHAVVVIGYGTENGEDYWLVRNSYSDSWGENGYVKMARNRNNHCGIANFGSFPIL